MFFDAAAVPRLRTIRRLRENLGINVAGIAVVLDLLDKLAALQRENELQRSRL
jgi:DNA-binding transcriptional MerR regulator